MESHRKQEKKLDINNKWIRKFLNILKSLVSKLCSLGTFSQTDFSVVT